MSTPNANPSDRATIAGVINPQSLAPGSASTGWVSMATYSAVQGVVVVGAITATGTVDAKLEQATSAAGAGAKDVTGKAITQLTAAGTDSNKQAVLNCGAEELDVNNAFTHVRLTVTTAAAAALVAGLLLGHDARYQPATDATTVDEVVA
jgi:hypothetical protein